MNRSDQTTIQIIKCVKDYPVVGGFVKEGTILTEDLEATKNEFDGTVFTSQKGIEYHFNNSEIFFSLDFQKSFKLLKRKIVEKITRIKRTNKEKKYLLLIKVSTL